ncbi:hypothetical protein D3C84_630990 [compost metagenome]
MHHAALDRPRPNDGDLDHQIVKRLRPEPGQHRHLRPGLDLEHADGVGPTDHFVGGRILGRDGRQAQVQAPMPAQQIETSANRTEHAQRQDIDLEQTDRIEVILVPLDDGALGHGGIFHRHQTVQRLLGNHETAGVLGQMPGEADQLPRQAQHPVQHRALWVKATFTQAFNGRRFIAPVTAAIGQGVDLVRRQAQGLGHIPHRTGRMVSADHRRQCGPGPTIALEHVLQDFFAAFMFEIDIDVRRLVSLFGQKALEQQRGAIRIDFGDAQGKTHRRVGGRTTTLTKNLLLAGKADDVVDCQEIAFIAQLRDQLQLLVDLLQHFAFRPFWPTPRDAFFGQMTQP